MLPVIDEPRLEDSPTWKAFIAKRHAIEDVKAKYRPRFAALQEQMQAEIDALERT